MTHRTTKILLIEDNPGDANMLNELLADVKRGSFDVEWVESLALGLERLDTNHIDVVVVDLALPDSEGLDTFIKVQSHVPQLPIIVVTGADDDRLALEAMQEGAQDYLVKGQLGGDLLARIIHYAIERKQVEQSLRESEERFRRVVTSISDLIYMIEITTEGAYKNHYLSPNVKTLTGYPLETFIADWSFWSSVVIHSDDQTRAASQMSRLVAGQNSEMEYRLVQADGQVIWVRDSARVEVTGDSIMIYGVVGDITEHKQLEEQYRQAQKMDAIGQLTGGIAHDFNNMLTAINGFAELLQMRLAPDNPYRDMVDRILDTGQRAAHLIRQLLAFSREQVIEPKVLDLNKVVTELDKMLHRIIGEDIEIRLILRSDLWSVKADPTQMEQIIVNLAINARDAMPDGGNLTIETNNVVLNDDYVVGHLGAQAGKYVLLTISDTGEGMSKEIQSRIFEPFFTTKERGKGTGLGLATIFGIVKQSNGDIQVYSEEGQGTTFKI